MKTVLESLRWCKLSDIATADSHKSCAKNMKKKL